MRVQKFSIGLLTALCVFMPFTLGVAQDLPAVSATNGKIGILGGNVDSDSAAALTGSLATPLGHSYGLQLDGLVGNLGSSGGAGLGVHLFWRDPEIGMFGITASKVHMNDSNLNRIGVEGEYYNDAFTFSGMAGHQSGDFTHGSYYGISARYYANDGLAISGHGESVSGNSQYTLGVEWQPHAARRSISYYVNASSGHGDAVDSVAAGVRFYLGESKSLKRRHREDDPENALFRDASFGMGRQDVGQQCPANSDDVASELECSSCFPSYRWERTKVGFVCRFEPPVSEE